MSGFGTDQGCRLGGCGGVALDRRAREGKADTRRWTHGEAHAQL
jgi:hypothetical protein